MKHSHTLFCLIHGRHKKPWQIKLASNYTLAAAIILPILTASLVGVLLVVNSLFAAKTVLYVALATVLFSALCLADRRGKIRFTGLYLVAIYVWLSFAITWSVGIELIPMVFCAWAIVLAGIICGFSSALIPATVSAVFLIGYRAAELQGMVQPSYSLSAKPTDFTFVILLVAVFYMVAAVSGMLHRLEQTRRTLWDTEETLATQKTLLTAKIKKQSQKLRLAESETMHHLYRLAEAGEASTILLHDLANTLTTLALEVDDIGEHDDSDAVDRVKQRISQIHSTLNATRKQMKGNDYKKLPFNIAKETTYTIDHLRKLATKHQVALLWQKPKDYKALVCVGDKILFRQLLANIITNAIESYGNDNHEKSHIAVALNRTEEKLVLTVTDWGVGISPEALTKIFEPFYTTKKGGMGMGMYVTKRFIEQHFKGAITARSHKGETIFTITLPLATDKQQVSAP